MKKAKDIIKSYLVPKLQKIKEFETESLNESFWFEFTVALLNFESDPKSLYVLLLNLHLNSDIKDKIISKIPKTYSLLISELAEEKLKGNKSEAVSILITNKSKAFEDEFAFITSVRESFELVQNKKRIIEELPLMYEKLQKDISNNDK